MKSKFRCRFKSVGTVPVTWALPIFTYYVHSFGQALIGSAVEHLPQVMEVGGLAPVTLWVICTLMSDSWNTNLSCQQIGEGAV